MRALCFLISYCFALSVGFSQTINISNPIQGAVYQRNGQDVANIRINGTFNSRSFSLGQMSVRAQFYQRNRITGAVSQTPAYTITLSRPGGITFSGAATIAKGWYDMRLLAYFGSTLRSTSRTQQVGVGDVFLIAGQSNAQGLPNNKDGTNDLNIAYPLPTYDGVRAQAVSVDPNIFGRDLNEQRMSQIKLKYLTRTESVGQIAQTASKGIAPTGASLWYWGRVGQCLSDQFDEPVAFYNVAWGGTYLKSFWETRNSPGTAPLGRPGFEPYPAGSPYSLIRTGLDLYGSTFGVRSVLWLQGETDVEALEYQFFPNGTPDWGNRAVSNANQYADWLKAVIAQSQQQISGLSWVVAKNAYFLNQTPGTTNNTIVKNGQDLTVSTSPSSAKTFDGPNLNTSSFRRRQVSLDGDAHGNEPVHFRRRRPSEPASEDGLAQVADAWCNSLMPIISNGSLSPVTTQSIGTLPELVTINANGSVSAPAGYGYQWVVDDGDEFDLSETPVATTQTIQVGGGEQFVNSASKTTNIQSTNSSTLYRAVLTDGQGRHILTQAVQLPISIVDDTEPTPTNCFEGETGSTPNQSVQNSGNALGGQFIGNFGNNDSEVSFTVNVPAAGTYSLAVTYAAYEGANISLQVNDGASQPRTLNATGGWEAFQTQNLSINLPAGSSTLKFKGVYNNYWRLDKFCVNTGTSNCDFTPSVSASNNSPGCGGSTVLTANCSGANCDGLSYSWSNSGGSNQTATFTLPNSNGTHTYSVQVSRSSCSPVNASKDFVLTDCGSTGTAVTKVRAYFRTDGCSDCQDRCAGALVQGSDNNTTWTTLTTLSRPNQGWNDYTVSNTQPYAYVRYVAAGGCYGELMELEFYAGSTKLTGTGIGGGTPNTYPGGDNGWAKAVDGDLGTFWHWASPGSHNWAGLQLGTPPPTDNCPYTNGQYLFPWYGEEIYAYRHSSGVWYASYQGGVNGFKPRSWLSATGNVAQDRLACFAQNNPNGRMASAEAGTSAEGLGLRIAPNPSSGRFVVHFRTQAGQAATLQISDMLGRAVRTSQTIIGTGDEHHETVTLPASVRGQVIVEVIAGRQRASQKVLIE